MKSLTDDEIRQCAWLSYVNSEVTGNFFTLMWDCADDCDQPAIGWTKNELLLFATEIALEMLNEKD